MANSIPKKRAKAEQLRKKRAQAASALAHGRQEVPEGHPSSGPALSAARPFGKPQTARDR
jgi:hypothetical protein